MNKYSQETCTVSCLSFFSPVPSLYLAQDWSHLLLHDASVPPSALPRRENCQEINPTPISNTPTLPVFLASPHVLLPLSAVKCPFCIQQKLKRNIRPYRSRHKCPRAHCSSVSSGSSFSTGCIRQAPPPPPPRKHL